MTAVPVERVEQLARLGGFERLRDFGVPEDELDELGAGGRRAAAARKANPRPASATEVAESVPLGLVTRSLGLRIGWQASGQRQTTANPTDA